MQINKRLFGFLFVLVGFGYLGDALDWWSFTIFFDGWWAILISILGFISIIRNGISLFNFILVVMGIVFFLQVNDYIQFDFTWDLFFAIGIILLGLSIAFFKPKRTRVYTRDEDSSTINYSNTLNSSHIIVDEEVEFLVIENTMGTTNIDLTKVNTRLLQLIKIENVMGTINLYLNNDIALNVNQDNVFGSINYKGNNFAQYTIQCEVENVFGSVNIYTKVNS